jgi:hypothetical protein
VRIQNTFCLTLSMESPGSTSRVVLPVSVSTKICIVKCFTLFSASELLTAVPGEIGIQLDLDWYFVLTCRQHRKQVMPCGWKSSLLVRWYFSPNNNHDPTPLSLQRKVPTLEVLNLLSLDVHKSLHFGEQPDIRAALRIKGSVATFPLASFNRFGRV